VFDPLDFLAEVRAHIPGAHEAIEDMLAEGDKVAVPLRLRGTQHWPMGPYPPSGGVMAADYLASTG